MITVSMVKTRSALQNGLQHIPLILSQLSQHLALTTFAFPDSTSQLAPPAEAVSRFPAMSQPERYLPRRICSPLSLATRPLAFSLPWSEVSDFLTAAQEIRGELEESNDREEKIWIMKAARSNGYGSHRTCRIWLRDGWTSFVDLIKVYLHHGFQA